MIKAIRLLVAFIFILNASFLLVFLSPAQAAGATLFLSPASASIGVGKTVTLKVMVNSGGGAGINAAEGSIKYDPSLVMATNVSKSGSIFSLWTSNGGEGPGYSNTAGTITFGGGSPSAYKGSAGTIFSVTFSAKKAGTADIAFTSGIVLAADGQGTNIYSGAGNAKLTITEAAKKEEPATKPVEEKKETTTKGMLPPIPEVSSATHPDENKWYPDNKPEFTWKILSDLTGVAYNVSQEAAADPGAFSEGISESKKFETTPDGINYFHIKFQNKAGWGQVAHKKFMVDVTPPEAFAITYDNGGDGTNPTPKLKFTTTDKTSGIASYSVVVNGQNKVVAPEEVASGYYTTDTLLPGEYNISIAAIDKAQNAASSSVIFIVEPLKSPIITSIPKSISKKDELIIRGTSFYPQVTIKVYIGLPGKDPQEFTTNTDDNGNWSYFHKGELDKGNYEVWAKVVDKRGAQSMESIRELLSIVSPSIICTYGLYIIIILLLIIIFESIYIWYRFSSFNDEKVRIRRETTEVKDKTRKVFYALREEADELIELTDKKPGLSENERRVKEKLREALDIAEEFINKEVEDIEKEINISKKAEK